MNAHVDSHEPLPEGEEPPPRGVKVMAVVRWGLILALAALALVMTVRWLAPAAADTAGAATLYQCPMHPSVTSSVPAECGICGMDLVAVENPAAGGDKLYQCPMHPKVTSKEPADCGICGMDLVLAEKKAPVAHDEPLYQCPMHPQVTSKEPGECGICGMDLVLVEKKERPSHAAHGENVPDLAPVHIPVDRIQKIGMRTAKAEVQTLSEKVFTLGVVTGAESRTAHVHTRFNGWIEDIFVTETGAYVKKGAPLVRIYSPEVLQARREYQAALDGDSDDLLSQQLRGAAEQRLRLLGVEPETKDKDGGAGDDDRTVTLYSHGSGHVIQKTAVHGLYVTPDTQLYEIADLSQVWVIVDVREDQLSRVQTGQKAAVEFPAMPGLTLEGTLSYIYPSVDPATRTLKARIELPNPKLRLKPGMFANVAVGVNPVRGVVVPSEAVVQTGRLAYAFVVRGEGEFEPRRVKLGIQAADKVEVLEGIEPGEEVVTSAIFLIDSESRLRASLEKLTASPPPSAHAGHAGSGGAP